MDSGRIRKTGTQAKGFLGQRVDAGADGGVQADGYRPENTPFRRSFGGDGASSGLDVEPFVHGRLFVVDRHARIASQQ
jgi:hypothetical protein